MSDSKPKPPNPLFEALVLASGLSPIFARSTLKRAAERAGVNVDVMTRADLEKALPSIQRAIDAFLPPGSPRLKITEGGGGEGGGAPPAAQIDVGPPPRRPPPESNG